MRILGIDPGTAIMGWGIIDADGSDTALVDYGALTTPKSTALPQRLEALYTALAHIVAQYQPEVAAVEELFFSKNVTTALAVGHARGIALLALAQARIPVYEYKPMAVKLAVTGYGRADKPQMQEMVRLTLGLDYTPQPDDAADAIAIALCHAYGAPLQARIEEA